MKVGEISKFKCPPTYTDGFIQLAIVLRKEHKKILEEEGNCTHSHSHSEPHSHSHSQSTSYQHSCGADFFRDMQENSDLLKYQGASLEFEFELLEFQDSGSFQREAWEMTNREKFIEIGRLKDVGNELFKKSNFVEAIEKYSLALGYVEMLTVSNTWEAEATTDDQEKLKEFDLSLRLNFSACKLKTQEFRDVIEQCTIVLSKDKNNQKALFRRATAYLRQGFELELAKKDLDKLDELFPGMSEVTSERNLLTKLEKQAKEKEKKAFSGMF